MIKIISKSIKGVPLLMRTAGVLSNDKVEIRSGYLKGNTKKFRSYFYNPIVKNKNHLPGILLVHGMSVHGIEDVRLKQLAKNLSACGYFVATPEFLEIKSLKIESYTIENIIETYIGLKKEKDLFNPDRLGFFSVSFSGGMGLLSLCDKKIRDDVRSVLVVGPYTDFKKAVSFILGNPNADEYGYFIFLYNYIHLAIKNSNKLKEVFVESAMDNGMHRKENSNAPKLIQKLSKRDSDILNKIKQSPGFRMEIGKEFLIKKPEIAKNLSPIFEIQKIKSHITLIHGKNDNVISAEESINASNVLTKFNRPHLLELTGLLSHGDKIPIQSQLGDIPGIARAFGAFLEHI